MSKLRKMKEISLAWSQNADINCYKKMLDYGPNNKIQFVWFIILLCSTLATLFFISKSITDYLSFDIVSQTNQVNDVPSQFPAVTFCDNNPFSTKESETFIEKIIQKNGIFNKSNDQLGNFFYCDQFF